MFRTFFSNLVNLVNKIVNLKYYRDYWFLREYVMHKEEKFFKLEFIKIYKILIEDLFWFKARFTYYLNNWIYTTNHKRIAVNYFLFVILAGCVGMILATLIRLEMAYPGVGVMAGDSIQYLSLVTAHAVVMVFFMIVPLIFGAFANFLLPTQMGVHDVAFPRMNSAAFWFLPGGLLLLAQLVCVDRRYQRMNCFNIKEVESLLKRKFFFDLITHNEHHSLIDNTTLGLRYKTNDISLINPHYNLISQYGLNIAPRSRNFFNLNKYLISSYDKSNFFHFFSLIDYFYNNNWYSNLYSGFISFSAVLNNLTYYLFYFNNFTIIARISSNWFILDNSNIYYLGGWDFNKSEFLKELFLYNWIIIYFVEQFFFFKHLLIFDLNSLYTIVSETTLFNLLNFTMTYNLSNFAIISNLSNFILLFIENLYLFYFNFLLILNYFRSLPFFFSKQESINLTYNDELDFNNKFNFNLVYVNLIENNVIIEAYKWNTIYSLDAENILDADDTETNFNWASFNFFFFHSDLILNYISYTNNFLNQFINFTEVNNYTIINFNFKDYIIPSEYWSELDTLDFDTTTTTRYDNNFTYILSYFNFIYYFNLIYYFNYFISIFSIKYYFWFIKLFFNNFSYLISDYFFNLYFFFNLYLNQNNFNLMANKVNYSKNLLHNSNFLYNNLETYDSKRFLRSDNPLFKYDDKAGSYFTDVYNKNYQHLWNSFTQVTRGQRRQLWFLSSTFNELFFNYFNNYSKLLTSIIAGNFNFNEKSHYKYLLNSYYLSHGDIFFFYWLTLNSDLNYLNKRWLVVLNLNQKFYNLFLTQTLQQRIFNNWRQLKFTRESWRCRLLSARHQKTLYRQYVNEDGLFWALERNARDLLPGWAMITPFSARTRFTAIGKTDIGLLGVGVVLVASMVSGVNFLITFRYLSTLNNRKMRDAKCFFTECILATNMMMICANPMLVIAIIMLLSDRHWNTSFFDYSGGGDTVLFQHMFWFFGHPEVYVIIVPTFGFTNTILSHYLRKRISARASLLYSIYTIAFLGFFVWGHHMYMVGLAHTTRMLYSTLTVMISVPAATKLMHWLVTLINSSWHYELPFIMSIMFIFLFTSGGISGMSVAHTGMDVLFHDTFFVVGHFHVMLAGSAMVGCFSGIYFYFPAIFGVKFNRPLAYIHVLYYIIGQLLTVIPMLWLGYGGMPRRVLDYPSALGGWHSMCSAGHMISVAAMISFFLMIYLSMRQGKPAIRTTFGVGRYNTRLNFYLYEISRIRYIRQKTLTFNRPLNYNQRRITDFTYKNYELYETTLYSYTFLKKK